MHLILPEPIQTFFDAANAGDAPKVATCFCPTATVLDEGETRRGTDAIRNWLAETKQRYSHVASPRTMRAGASETIVTAQVTGTFKGSPILLDYHFDTAAGLIERLRITAT